MNLKEKGWEDVHCIKLV